MAQSKHGVSFEIIERGPNNSWQTWLASCKCGAKFTDKSYEATEDKWRVHVFDTTGFVCPPVGNKDGRWSPMLGVTA